LIQRLQADIPGIRIAVVAHGDYCDTYTYITKHIDFSTNVGELCDWVKNIGGTGGGIPAILLIKKVLTIYISCRE
jgi:hypothetical protein